jgi:hypothetical protein
VIVVKATIRVHLRKLRRQPLRIFAVLALVASGLLAMTGVSSATTALAGQFELDGNAVDNSVAATPDDWGSLVSAVPTGVDFTGIVPDVPLTDATYFTGGGSKDPLDVPGWKYNANSAPAKDEITDAYGAAYLNSSGQKVIYFGADRIDNSGDSQIGFWFFQNEVKAIAGGKFSGVHQKPDSTHPHGDVLVLSDFTNGGRIGTVNVYEWVGSGGSDGAINHIYPTSSVIVDCQDPAANNNVCGTVNTGDGVVSPWPFRNKSGQTTFAHGEFYEGGINIGALLPGGNPCFASFLAETRSSQSPSAVLKDFVLHAFEPCNPNTSMLDTAATAVPSTIHAGESVVMTFYDHNSGNTIITSPSVSTTPTAAGCNPTAVGGVAGGDADNDTVFDPGETWAFTCTTTLITTNATTAGTVITATADGLDPLGRHVTFPMYPLERTSVTVLVINPITTLTTTASAVITYTFSENNGGDAILAGPSVSLAAASQCDSAPAYQSGDGATIGSLDPGETWVFTCTKTLEGPATDTGSASATATGTGHGTDVTGADVTHCDVVPTSGKRCSTTERDGVTVTITNAARD